MKQSKGPWRGFVSWDNPFYDGQFNLMIFRVGVDWRASSDVHSLNLTIFNLTVILQTCWWGAR